MGEKADRLAATGAQPIVCDVFDREALATAVRTFSPDVEGTRNLLDAVQNWEHTKIVAQSIAWPSEPGPGADSVASLEGDPPEAPRVHIDTAAARTLDALDARPGIMTVVDN